MLGAYFLGWPSCSWQMGGACWRRSWSARVGRRCSPSSTRNTAASPSPTLPGKQDGRVCSCCFPPYLPLSPFVACLLLAAYGFVKGRGAVSKKRRRSFGRTPRLLAIECTFTPHHQNLHTHLRTPLSRRQETTPPLPASSPRHPQGPASWVRSPSYRSPSR